MNRKRLGSTARAGQPSAGHRPSPLRHSRRSALALAHWGLAAALLGGCLEDEPTEPPEPCGTAASGCSQRQHCDRVAAPARCVCDEGYTGSRCDQCALGYTSSGGSCVAQPIDCREGPCGSRGRCSTDQSGDDICICDQEYTGQRCANCTDGFQDHDRDGICRPACGVADVFCPGNRVCSDVTGAAICLCEEGYTGDSCSECAEGYRELPTGNGCVPTCKAAEVRCSEFATCVERVSGAVCECLPGWGGANCDQCALGYSQTSGGNCATPVPLEATLLTLVEQLDHQLLAALTPPSWDLKVLVPIQGELADIAWDVDDQTLYGVNAEELVRVAPATGELTRVGTTSPVRGETLTYDSERQLLYVGTTAEVLSVDPSSGEVTTLIERGARALAYDPGEDRLLGLEWASSAARAVRFDVDLDSLEITERGGLADTRPLIDLGLAVDPVVERPYLVGAIASTPTDALVAYCKRAAAAVGSEVDGSTVAGTYGQQVGPGEALVLDDAGTDPRLLVYGSEGNAPDEPATLEIATAHPDAVVCIVTREQPLRIVVDANARFRTLVVVSETNNLQLEIPDAFEAQSAMPIHIHVQGGSASLDVPADLGTLYEDEAWEQLGLGYLSLGEAANPIPTLTLLDWDSGAGVARNLSSPPLTGGLTSYSEGE